MDPSSLTSFTLYYLLFLLVPGLLSLRVLFHMSGKKYDLSRTHLVVYSTVLSVASALLLYLFSGLLYPIVDYIGVVLDDIVGLSTVTELSDLDVSALLLVFLIHIGVTIGVGLIIGYLWWRWRKYRNIDFDPREAWEFAFEESPDHGEMVEVALRSGRVIQGEFNPHAFDADERELFLDNPWVVRYGDDGEEIKNRADMGRAIYLHSDAIEEVVFIEEDPNVEQSESIREESNAILSEGMDESLQNELDKLEVDTISPEDINRRFEFIED